MDKGMKLYLIVMLGALVLSLIPLFAAIAVVEQ